MSAEIPDVYRLKAMELAMADPHSMGVHKALQEVYPALAKKLFEGNKLMEVLVMSGRNMADIMTYPICGKCETLALWSGWKQCTCTRTGCNSTTKNPPTLRDWLKYEMRKKMTAEQLEYLDIKIDMIADSMLRKFKHECRQAYEQHNAVAREKMLVTKLNTNRREDDPTVKHGKINVPEDVVIIPDEIGEE